MTSTLLNTLLCLPRPWALRGFPLLAISLILGTAVGLSSAQPDEGGSPVVAPPNTELLVQFENLAGQLESPAGVGMRGLFVDLGLFDRTADSWNALSEALSLEPGEAIDALLGGRFLLLADQISGTDAEGMPTADAPLWACVMSIGTDLGRRIPKALKAAPRGSVAGRTVYAIEDGRLMVMPVGSSGQLLAVASAGSEELLRSAGDLAAGWSTERKPANAEADDKGNDRPADGIVVYRQGSSGWLTGTIHGITDGWDFRFSVVDPAARGGISFSQGQFSPRIDSRWYDRVTAGAGIAYAGPIEVSDPNARRDAELPDALRILGHDLQSLRKWAAVFLPFNPPAPFVRGEADFGMLTTGADRAASVWLRVPDAVRAAKIGDAHVCDLVGTLAGAGIVATDAPECTGRYPNASRRVSLPEDQGETPETAGLGFAWGIASVSVAGDAPQAWWSMHSIPTGRRPPSMAPGLSSDPASPGFRFSVRPGVLIGRLAENGGMAGILAAAAASDDFGLRALRRIEIVDLTLVPGSGEGMPVSGTMRVRFDSRFDG